MTDGENTTANIWSEPVPEKNSEPSPTAAESELKPDPTPESELKPVEAWKAELNTPEWLFAAARNAQNWPDGLELSEAEYSKATASAEGEVIG
jgi:hypothetical protein